jgi:transketolase
LSNLTAIVDHNKLQSYGPIEEVLPLRPLDEKLEAFGFSVRQVDGHDVDALRDVLRELPFDGKRPNAIIAHTVKGKGIHFAEHDAAWHHKAKVDRETVDKLRLALEQT